MPVTVRYAVSVYISKTSAEGKELGNQSSEVVVSTMSEGGTWKTYIPPATVNQELFLPNVALAKLLVIITNARDPSCPPATISIRRNLITAEEIAIVPISPAKEGHLLLSTEGLSALYASNAGTEEMEVTVAVAGD